MSISQKVEAEALRIGMLAGIFTRADAVAWADALVGELDKPSSELIDLSCSDGTDGSSFAALLSAIPGQPDPELTKKLLFAKLAKKLAASDVASIGPCVSQLADLAPFNAEEKAFAGKLGSISKADAEKFLAAYVLPGPSHLLG